MKKLLNILKVVVPIGLAIYLFWTTFSDPEKLQELKTSLDKVNYFYIFLTLVVVFISHAARARRWSFLLEPLGYKTKFSNAFYSVMIGYVLNMIIPRAGEISRAAFFSRVEKIPAEKAFGTIAAERIIDLIALATITFVTFYIERETAWKNALDLYEKNKTPGDSSIFENPWLYVVGVVMVILTVLFFKNAKVKAFLKKISSGLWEGVMSIITTKKKWQFVLYTLLIWGSYLLMFYIPFLSLDSTKDIKLGAIFVAFVFSAFSIVITPGGTGAYHKAIGIAVGLYGYSIATGEALGLIIWSAQALFNIVVGLLSLYLINKTNENYLGHTSTNNG